MQVITDAKELRKYTYAKVRNVNVFPKKDRMLADAVFNEARELVADLMEANDYRLDNREERAKREMAQRSALRHCRKLLDDIEMVHEILPGLGNDAFTYWSKLATGVKNQTAKWYKSDRDRIAKMIPNE